MIPLTATTTQHQKKESLLQEIPDTRQTIINGVTAERLCPSTFVFVVMTKTGSEAPNLPDWLGFLTPSKPPRDEDSQSTNTTKEPHVISGKHDKGNLKVIKEDEQDLVRDISPKKCKQRQYWRDDDHENSWKSSSSLIQWFLLLLWLTVAYVTLSTHPTKTTTIPQSELNVVLPLKKEVPLATPPTPTPAAAAAATVTPATVTATPAATKSMGAPRNEKARQPARNIPVKRKPFETRTAVKRATGIPQRIFHIIKQELSPFPTTNVSSDTETKDSPPEPMDGSQNVLATLDRITTEVLEKLKEILAMVIAFLTAETPRHGCTGSHEDWKWILDRGCRREREERSMESSLSLTGKSATFSSAKNMAGSHGMDDSCDNLVLRRCRQTKRALLAQPRQHS